MGNRRDALVLGDHDPGQVAQYMQEEEVGADRLVVGVFGTYPHGLQRTIEVTEDE